jgi:hypothetical protein
MKEFSETLRIAASRGIEIDDRTIGEEQAKHRTDPMKCERSF